MVLISTLMVVTPAVAAETWIEAIIGQPLIPKNCTDPQTEVDSCTLNDAFQVIVNLSTLIVAMTGTAALLMFTYGGVMWIIAAGSQERVQKGTAAIQAAVIGIVIVLGAWLVVNFTINALTGGQVGSKAKIFTTVDWSRTPSGE